MLGAVKARKAVPDLMRIITGPDAFIVQLLAIEAVGRIGDASVVPALRKQLRRTRHAKLEEGLEKAIAKLEGRELPKPERPPYRPPEIRTGTPFSETIEWASDIDEAVARARRERKLVLATVVPLGDRRWSSGFPGAEALRRAAGKPHPWGDARAMAIDSGLVKERAMMASLFSDPVIVALVREHFVAVRVRMHVYEFDHGTARGANPLRALGTSGVDLQGPALVFSRPGGALLHACGRMGVFSVPMVRAMVRAVLERAGVSAVVPETPLAKAWAAARRGAFAEALARLDDSAEARYLRAHVLDKQGEVERARGLWEGLVVDDRHGPWGSRAAVRLQEREGRLDEWETFAAFDVELLAKTTEVRLRDLDGVLERAVAYLLGQQRPDGQWRDPFVDTHPMPGPGSKYDKSVPRTGLVVDALIRMRGRVRGLDDAIERGLAYVGAFADAPKPHTWKLTYALHAQVAVLRSDLGEAAKRVVRRWASRLVEALGKVQHQGGWSYMPPPRIHSFNTAPVLLMLTEFPALGVDVPARMREDAASFLEGLRREKEPREFSYAANIHHQTVRSSSCRTALCELALLEHRGGRKLAGLRAGVKLFFEHEPGVRDTTKVFESFFSPTSMHDAYHYFFGHYYAARAFAKLPKAEAKRRAKRQIDVLLGQVELDGSFVDAQMQGKSYSTAMAVLTLLEDLRYVD